MNADNVSRIEKDIASIVKERQKSEEKHDVAIETEKSRDTVFKDKQAQTVEALKLKRDAVLNAYDGIILKKRVELEVARSELATITAKQNAELEKQADKLKRDALRAFIQAGGLPQEFEAHWKAVLVARTTGVLEKPDERRPLVHL